jgi:glycosyltransferase involved in cell wall biosynthesis
VSDSPSQPPIRILHIFKVMDRGGAEMRTLDVMRTTTSEAYKLDYCALSGETGELEPEIQQLGGRVHHCKLDVLFIIRFYRLLRRERYDVVHSHVLLVSGFILFLARAAGVPNRIAHFRSTGSRENAGFPRRIRDSILRFMLDKSATRILAVSNGALDANWLSFKPMDHRCQVLYSGINAGAFEDAVDHRRVRGELDIPPDSPLFIHVGRFNPAKNHERLLDIFKLVHESLPTARLMLVGGGDASIRTRLQSRIQRLGLEKAVFLLGTRDDIPILMLTSDVMIFPSLWEGLPGVLLEAVAAGLPTVTSDVPGALEIAEHFESIKPMSLGCSDVEWAQAIVSLYHSRRSNSALPIGRSAVAGTPFDLDVSRSLLEEAWQAGTPPVLRRESSTR